ncbi:hypothetical protein BOTBODRAFT_31429 [Botryobasidium botryosum FD-172 SS1]|uniref:Uncharacterized protein n=1 Tax=Botryobasidium botryosum (strain FD-172 SS1) TaxID=930990 RepID=A0A067MVS3_BOTB1|nr:hypothetical protein BOTBODRAFT_31429 [Botryobasidium botryosum FD-172 SS1]
MSSISSLLPSDALVLRDLTQTTLLAAGLVPGDLVYIKYTRTKAACGYEDHRRLFTTAPPEKIDLLNTRLEVE